MRHSRSRRNQAAAPRLRSWLRRSGVGLPPHARGRLLAAVAALAVGVLAAALIAGCGDDSDDTEPAAPASTATSTEEVIVQSSKGSFNPTGIYERAAPGVVTVISIFGQTEDILLGGGAGQGSGFVIDDGGEILTNAHVVTQGGENNGGGKVTEAKQVFVQFADRNRVQAEVVGADPESDVALLKVDPEGLELKPLTLSDGEGIAVGAPVAAIGSPFGEEQSLSIGVISATDRSIPSLTKFQIAGAIQTDASINPGNSGGPLLNADGEVIGINQQIESASGSDAGVGFAVPVSLARYSLDQLREDGSVDYAYIGVSTVALWPQLADELGIDADSGALIGEVFNGSPADEAGLEGGDDEIRFQGARVPTGGDVIVAVEGERLVEEADLSVLISRHRPGETITLDVIRDGDRREVEVKLGTRPDNPPGG